MGSRMRSIYQFGAKFDAGPQGTKYRILVLVDKLDLTLLNQARNLTLLAQKDKIELRFDIAKDVLRSADVFPVFSMILIDTRKLIAGEDLLAPLSVHPADLRLNIEHNLRSFHRTLLQTYVSQPNNKDRAIQMRRHARKMMYLIEAILLMLEVDISSAPEPEHLIALLGKHAIDSQSTPIWERLLRFSRFEDALKPEELERLYCDVLAAISELVDVIDTLEVHAH